jgi:hypothetical protein
MIRTKVLVCIILLVSFAFTVGQFWSATKTQKSLNNLSSSLKFDKNAYNCTSVCNLNTRIVSSDTNTAKNNLIGYWFVLCVYTVGIYLLVPFVIFVSSWLPDTIERQDKMVGTSLVFGLVAIGTVIVMACVANTYMDAKRYLKNNQDDLPNFVMNNMHQVYHYSSICFGISLTHFILSILGIIAIGLIAKCT